MDVGKYIQFQIAENSDVTVPEVEARKQSCGELSLHTCCRRDFSPALDLEQDAKVTSVIAGTPSYSDTAVSIEDLRPRLHEHSGLRLAGYLWNSDLAKSFQGIGSKLAQGFQMCLLATSGGPRGMGKVMGAHIAFARNQLGTAFTLQVIRSTAPRLIYK